MKYNDGGILPFRYLYYTEKSKLNLKKKMAMEKQYVVRDTHTRSITAVGYNPIRREIALGCEGKNFVKLTPSQIPYS